MHEQTFYRGLGSFFPDRDVVEQSHPEEIERLREQIAALQARATDSSAFFLVPSLAAP
jgi:hypothetical protein